MGESESHQSGSQQSESQWHLWVARAFLGAEVSADQVPAELAALVDFVVRQRTSAESVRRVRLAAEQAWPIPPEAGVQLPWAQYAAAVTRVRAALALEAGGVAPALAAGAQLDREGQRLLADRPPHW